MARPRLVLSASDTIDDYESIGSVRGSAKGQRVARSVAARTLRQNGIELPDREEGYRRQKLLQQEPKATKSNVIHVEKWGRGDPSGFGVTEVKHITEEAVDLCVICEHTAADEGNLCGRCNAKLAHPARGRCPFCGQDATMGDVTCYFHTRKLRGEM